MYSLGPIHLSSLRLIATDMQLWSSCSVVDLLWHHPLALSSSVCSFIAPLLCRRLSALSSTPCSVVVCLLFHRPLLCHRLSALSSSPALSSSLCFFIVSLLTHSPPALSSSHYSVTIVPVLCHYSVLCYSILGSITDR